MHSSSFLAPAVGLLGYATADFHIYHMNTISTDPYAGGGYMAIFNNLVSHDAC